MTRILALATLLLSFASANANNIQISNLSVNASTVTFTLSWENSWNTTSNIDPLYPNNWDGAWVFVKYQNNIDNLWKSAKLSNQSSDHTISGGPLQIDAVSDSMGVFVRRTNPGSGNVSATITLKMGPLVGTGTFNFKVFGVEMVYVPQGDYQLGDGQVSGTSYFSPQTISSAQQSNGLAPGALFTSSPSVPAAFPMGYNAFYCMKYEISSEQWVDFLNTLTYDQQAARTAVSPNSGANFSPFGYNDFGSFGTAVIIKTQTPGQNNTTPAVYGCNLDADAIFNEVNDGQTIAVNGINKADLMAYLDWSGLRPMTEMEFEKGCRGTQNRVSAEYAWGSTDVAIRRRNDGVVNGGTASELTAIAGIADGRLNATTNTAIGSLRCGVFAENATGRESSGAAFWGMMEMSGNAFEMAVYTDAAGVQFTGAHGNGSLTTTGISDVVGWPSSTSATAPFGMGARGGCWAVHFSQTQLSYRLGGFDASRHQANGGRGVRTAP